MGTLGTLKFAENGYNIVEHWRPRFRRTDTRQIAQYDGKSSMDIFVSKSGDLTAMLPLPDNRVVECNIEMDTGFDDMDGNDIYEGDVVEMKGDVLELPGDYFTVTLGGALGQWNLRPLHGHFGHMLCEVYHKCRVAK